MYSRIIAFLFCVLFALTSCVNEPMMEDVKIPSQDEAYSAGEVFVKFTPEVAGILEEAGVVRSAVTRSGVSSVDAVLDLVGGFEISRVFPRDSRHEERTVRDGLNLWYIVRYSNDYSAEEVSRRFSQLGEVQKVDLNRTVKRANTRQAQPLSEEAMAKMVRATRASENPLNDELYSQQWNLANDGTMFLGTELTHKVDHENGDENSKKIKSVAGADVQVVEAWKKSTGDSSVIVAVLDEGIYVEHPDLQDNIWVNAANEDDLNEDKDKNGYKGDKYGYNFVKDTGKITWNGYYDSGHGTHVAGTIAAVNNNSIGVSSIAGGDGSKDSGVKIMVCQIFAGNVSTGLYNVVRAMKYAADNGAVVLQCSWGYVSGAANQYEWGEAGFASEEAWIAGSPIEKEALDYFINNAGSPNGVVEGGIAVFAAGNEYAPQAGYPGAAEYCVSVAATAADFTPAVYTNYGPGTTISAPGGDQDYYYDYLIEGSKKLGEAGCILSTLPYHISKTGYGYMEGTSMACPHVSAVVALGLSYAAKLRKHFKAEEIREMLYAKENVTPIDDYMKGTKYFCRYVADVSAIQPNTLSLAPFKGQMGAGQVNATKFLAAIEGSGVAMHFPNVVVKVGGAAAFAPAMYFVGGEELTYTVEIADMSVATCESKDGKIVFSGLQSGTTTAVIKASNGENHSFNITVRKADGWM
ncbi:MAG: S8 family serine peptidase [Alistipes sp.]|nr:S8 family serine peptidase [Alistipes sp.]